MSTTPDGRCFLVLARIDQSPGPRVVEVVFIHSDQLEVSPDGHWLYLNPCCGPMARVPTALIDDAAVGASTLKDAVEYFAATGSTGGTAIADDGTIYISNTDACRISAIDPDGPSTCRE